MPFVWAAIGAIVTAYFSEKWCKRVVRGSLLASYIPLVRDPALAQAYAQSIGMTGSPEMMAMFHRLLDEVRAEMAAGRISFKLRGDDDGPSGFTVDLLHPATAAAGALMLPGYDWPIAAGPSGANWTFDSKGRRRVIGRANRANGQRLLGLGPRLHAARWRHRSSLGLRASAATRSDAGRNWRRCQLCKAASPRRRQTRDDAAARLDAARAPC